MTDRGGNRGATLSPSGGPSEGDRRLSGKTTSTL